MRAFLKLVTAGAALLLLLQAVRPGIPVKPATAELAAPVEVRHILEKDCYSCHSDEKRLSWFDRIVPAYWLVRSDILTAREHLNFSTLGSEPAAAQKATLYEAVNMIQLGAMPLPQFLKLHPEAEVTPEELDTLKAYLAPWTPVVNHPGGAPSATQPGAAGPVDLGAVRLELDGFPFDSSFESWKPISTTDRGDNGTFRFILGNDIAIEAAQSGKISPWPDGARFAKIAWQQQTGPDGLVRPGKFVQVELMLKDAHRYQSTEGWGWGRWRGLDLKPYGKDAGFVRECTSCHQPVRGDDYVYTLPITEAKSGHDEVVNNRAAMLPASLPYRPLGWAAITMFVDPQNRTTATLYGNEIAMQAAHMNHAVPVEEEKAPAYGTGAVLALVTWAQRDDPHWFGGRIPDLPLSVEFVQIAASGRGYPYRRFAGLGLTEVQSTPGMATQRKSWIESLTPAQLP